MAASSSNSDAAPMKGRCVEVVVVPSSSKQKIEPIERGAWRIFVKNRAQDGKANEEALRVLARYLGVDQNKLKIIRGLRQRRKWIKIQF